MPKRMLQGTVVSDTQKKTIVVRGEKHGKSAEKPAAEKSK